jgi:hypothetical protein
MKIDALSLKVGQWVKFSTDVKPSTLTEEQQKIYQGNRAFLVINRDDGMFDPCRCFLIDVNDELLYDYCPRMNSLGGAGDFVWGHQTLEVPLEEVLPIYGREGTLSIYLRAQQHIERINANSSQDASFKAAPLKNILIPAIFTPAEIEQLKVRRLAMPSKFTLALAKLAGLPPEERFAFVMSDEYDPRFGRDMLSMEADNPQHVGLILDLIPESQRLQAITKKRIFGYNLLQGNIENLELLQVILDRLPRDVRCTALCDRRSKRELYSSYREDTYNSLQDAVKHPDAIKLMLNSLQPEERLQIIQWSFADLSTLDPALFQVIQHAIPKILPESFPEIVINSLNSLLANLIRVPSQEYLVFLSQATIKIRSIDVINNLDLLFKPLPDSDKPLLLDAMVATQHIWGGLDTLMYGLKVAEVTLPEEYQKALQQDTVGNFSNTMRFFSAKKAEGRTTVVDSSSQPSTP